jgi:predicted phage terminase large subunit-like protein
MAASGRDSNDHFWLLDFMERRLGFIEQQEAIEGFGGHYERELFALGIEAVAYQAAQANELKRKHPNWPIRKVYPLKDKVTRAWKLTPLFQQHRVHFKPEHFHVIERLVSFPHGHDDLFDAVEIALGLLRFKPRERKRREEPGLL